MPTPSAPPPSAAEPPFEPPPGASLAGRYTLHSVLGRGGMGVVWRAYDEVLHRTVAVKEVLLPQGVPDQDRSRLRARTLREARAVAAVDDPSTVRVFDVVEQGGRPWIVMEYVRGRTLTEVLREHGPLSPGEVARVGLALVGALDTAHRAGVLHRDVKPSNVLLREDGRVALTDFGIATVASDPSDPTTTGQLLGSPAYIAPERVQGARPTPASDLWSLGATLWTAVEGRPPFSGPSALATVTAVVHDPPPACQTCTAGLGDLLLRMMAKDPAARPDAATVQRELRRVREHDHSPALDAPPDTLPVAFDQTMVLGGAVAPQTQVPGPRQRRRWPWLVAVLLGVVGVAATLSALSAGPDRRTGTRAKPPTAVSGARTASTPSPARSRRGSPSASPSPSPSSSASPTPSTAGSPSPATPPPTPAGRRGGATPAGWQRYTDPAVGWSIAHPPGWQLRVLGGSTDFVDPAGHAYLRVETRYPPGPSAEGAWQDQETYFQQTHDGYQRIFLDTVRYCGYDAADWEFRYLLDGVTLHALDHGFVAGGRGYALYFQTRDEDWDAAAPTMRAFWRSFRPAVG